MRFSPIAASALSALVFLFAGAEVHAREPVTCDAIGCSDCGSDFTCENNPPLWTATADALFLQRSDPQSSVLAFNTANNAENLNAGQFDFDTEAGFDLSLSRSIGARGGLSIRYFGVDGWDSAVAAGTTPNELLQFNSAPPIFAISGDGIAANYASKLHNAEINLSHQCYDWLNIAAGFRYLELDERGSASLINAAVPLNYGATTSNRLYGAQLGLDGLLWCRDAFSINATGKAGIYGNHSAHHASVSTGAATLTANGRDDLAAFIGEIGLIGNARLSECVSIRSGYRLLWLDGVAVASDQLGATDFFAGSGLDSSGNVFYHGAFIGLELRH